jgi:hypothetical protein
MSRGRSGWLWPIWCLVTLRLVALGPRRHSLCLGHCLRRYLRLNLRLILHLILGLGR